MLLVLLAPTICALWRPYVIIQICWKWYAWWIYGSYVDMKLLIISCIHRSVEGEEWKHQTTHRSKLGASEKDSLMGHECRYALIATCLKNLQSSLLVYYWFMHFFYPSATASIGWRFPMGIYYTISKSYIPHICTSFFSTWHFNSFDIGLSRRKITRYIFALYHRHLNLPP